MPAARYVEQKKAGGGDLCGDAVKCNVSTHETDALRQKKPSSARIGIAGWNLGSDLVIEDTLHGLQMVLLLVCV